MPHLRGGAGSLWWHCLPRDTGSQPCWGCWPRGTVTLLPGQRLAWLGSRAACPGGSGCWLHCAGSLPALCNSTGLGWAAGGHGAALLRNPAGAGCPSALGCPASVQGRAIGSRLSSASCTASWATPATRLGRCSPASSASRWAKLCVAG